MGQKQSAKRKRTVQDRASATDRNAVKRVGVFGAIRKLPSKYLDDRTIADDPSMRRMQMDLVSFDDTVRRSCFSRKKDKYDYQDEQYYDQNQQSISDDDERYLQPIQIKNSSWQCRYCAAENKSTTIKCRQCKEIETRF
jgi:hypothetical protein